jgi:hypothetical protein
MAAMPSIQAANLLTENFNDISTLPGAGWVLTNNSSPAGVNGWFQGDYISSFSAQSGAASSYIAANFLNADGGGNISNWLILPTLSLNNGDTLSFYTRSGQGVPDDLEVRFSSNGSSSNVGSTDVSTGDFSTLLLDVNPTLAATGFPDSWTQYNVTLTGLGGPVSGRFAFRYHVVDTFVNGDYIGIDSVSVDQTPSVPEPSTFGIFLAGMSCLIIGRRSFSSYTSGVRSKESV